MLCFFRQVTLKQVARLCPSHPSLAVVTAALALSLSIPAGAQAQAPAKPATPTVTVHSSTSLSVSWTAPTSNPAVTDYDVQYRVGTTGDFTDAGYDGAGTGTTLYGLAQVTSYQVQVRARNGDGSSDIGPWSDSGSATTARFSATLTVSDANIAEVGDTRGTFKLEIRNIPQSPPGTNTYEKLCVEIHHLHQSEARLLPNPASHNIDWEINHVWRSGNQGWNNKEWLNSRTSRTLRTPNDRIDMNMYIHFDAIDDLLDDDDEEIRYEINWIRATDSSCQGGPSALISGNPKSLFIQDDDPGYSLTASSEQGSDTEITEGNTADDQATLTLTVNKVEPGVTKAHAAYTYSVSGLSSGDGVAAATGGQSLGATGTIDIPISSNQGTATITVTAAADADGHDETAVFTLTGITFSGGGGADIDDFDTLSDAVTIRILDETGGDSPVALDDRIKVPKGGTATTLVGGATSVRANDSDRQTATSQLTVAVSSNPSYAAASGFTLNQDGTFSYTHDDSANHADSFTYTVTDGDGNVSNAATVSIAVSTPPVITDPGDKTFAREQQVDGFDIVVTDAEETPTVTVTGLPPGLLYDRMKGQVRGSVYARADLKAYTATITADDGVNAPVTEDFTVTVVHRPPRFPGGATTTTRSIAENSAAGSNVGDPVAARRGSGNFTYALSGTDAASFAIASTTGQITTATGTSLDYETKSSYAVTVTATDTDMDLDVSIAVTISVTDVNEPPAKPAAPTLAASSTTPKTSLDVSWTAPDTAGRPDISDYDLQYREQDAEDWTSHDFTGTETSTTLTGLSAGKTYQVQVLASNDEGDSSWSDSGTGSTESTNAPPAFPDPAEGSDSLAREVAENSAAGSSVGAPVTATDAEGDTLTYSLSGADASAFAIDSSMGQISVATGTSIDYETKTSYSVTVSVSDGKDADGKTEATAAVDGTVAVTINVTDVNEPPAKPAAPTVAASSTAPKTSLAISWTAPDTTGRPDISDYDLQYREQDAADWTSHDFTGTQTSTTLTGLTKGKTYQVQVLARNDEGDSSWSDSGTGSTDPINHAPVLPDPGEGQNNLARAVAENSAAGSNVGAPVTATDPEGDTLTYSLSGADATSFAIDSATGQITVATGTSIDYETKTSYSVTVGVTDGKDADGNTEATAAVDGTVAVTISVTDVNEAPAKPAAPTVARSTTDPRGTLDVSWTAPDTTGRPDISDYDLQYREQDAADWTSHDFTGTQTSTTLTGLSAGKTYQVQVLARNDEGDSSWSDSGSGSTASANSPPSFPDPGEGSDSLEREVAENSAAGSSVGAPVTATDAEGDTLTYSLSGADASAFAIDSATGQITVAAGTELDYETKTSYSVTVGVSDGKDADGNTEATAAVDGTVAVTISVTDEDEPPGKPAAPSVARSTTDPRGTLDVSWTKPDVTGRPDVTGYGVQYRKQGTTAWTAHAHSGVTTSTSIADLEAGVSYQVQVNAANDDGTSSWSDSGSGSTDGSNRSPVLPTPPSGTSSLTRNVAENSAAGTVVGATVVATDADGDTLTYSLTGSSAFAIRRRHGPDQRGHGGGAGP